MPDIPLVAPGNTRPELTLLVAGCRGGKSAFLRLLIDTSEIFQGASKEQLQSVARFVQGCSGHTSNLRTASVDIDVDGPEPLALTLVDTPSLDFKDEPYSERVVSETLRFIESRLAEGGDEDWVAQNGDRYVHLCIYFLDPDQILPPAVAAPPAPLVSRTRASSFSQPDQEPVILEPPVTTNPLLYRPTLPLAEISTIRRLSARVNVLPVIARADVLSNDRLAAIKMAIRRDLADNGIGFGIFDVDHYPNNADDLPPPHTGDPLINYPNGAPSTAANSPPTSPVASPLLRLPYALISPDIYSHSDGVPRIPPSRHELVLQYAPSPHSPSPKKNLRGKFVRTYRWGTVDVLDPSHSDFVPLRAAIFHHMKTLQKYTREYLFDKFRIECLPQRPSSRHLAPQHPQHSPPHLTPLSLSHSSRPILAIDTAPRSASIHRGSSHHTPREISLGGDVQSAPVTRDPMSSGFSSRASAPASAKQRSKKITVACNFCRSRKLKCDGGRPSCSQCMKRSNTCDYAQQNKRRGAVRPSRGDESESESGDDRSAEFHEPSLSPEVSSRRSSNFDTSPSLPLLGERRDELPPINTSSRAGYSGEQRNFFPDNELPHIATLSLPETSPSTPGPMSAPSLPPLRPASEQQAAQRKRSATVPGKGTRLPSTSGPKVVACNFCRARKTKCDGAHPSCSSCARRLLPCNYVNDSSNGNGNGPRKASSRRASTSKDSLRSTSPPSSRMLPTPSSAGYDHDGDVLIEEDMDLKRSLEHPDAGRPSPSKKIKMDGPMNQGIP
ncbi:GTP binding protein [Mycena maculata]|uniref:GTP binding protein n=1 Tax=Mycena maculata TaxID=230809 RepID=A0AAD7JFM6_9AGAR|nr:GTP binding protein [Mycena maculata]